MAMISGVGIQNQEPQSVTEEYLDNLLRSVNEQNTAKIKAQDEELKAQAAEAEEADRLARQAAREATLRERYEEEQRVLAQIKAEEEAEEKRLAEEAAARQQAMPWNRMAEALKKKSQGKKEKKISAKTKEIAPTDAETVVPKEAGEEATEEIVIENDAVSANEPENVDVKPAPIEEKTEKPAQKEKPKKEKLSLFGKKTKPEETAASEPELDFEYLATHDEKTGLLNNTAFKLNVEKMPVAHLAMIYFDVNNLKQTNDTMGHAYGDKLISATADALEKVFPGKGYRTGGDEFIVLLSGVGSKAIEKKLEKFDAILEKKTAEDEDNLVYSVSHGYALGNGKMSKQEIQEAADQNMYEKKTAYKKAHPPKQEEAPKQEAPKQDTPKKKVAPKKSENYDDLLPRQTRELKHVIRDTHRIANEESTERILYEIQRRHQEISAILVASPSFDHLFIIRDIRHFLNLCVEMDGLLDYSYLYVCYDGGPQYYGADDYYSEVTHLFEEIANNIKYNRTLTDKELLKIKGINIFKEIYLG